MKRTFVLFMNVEILTDMLDNDTIMIVPIQEDVEKLM